jgi:hypothetical protein
LRLGGQKLLTAKIAKKGRKVRYEKLWKEPNMHSGDLTPEIIGAAIKIHRKLGPGLLESAYEACMAYEVEKLGLRVERQKPVPLIYEGGAKAPMALTYTGSL